MHRRIGRALTYSLAMCSASNHYRSTMAIAGGSIDVSKVGSGYDGRHRFRMQRVGSRSKSSQVEVEVNLTSDSIVISNARSSGRACPELDATAQNIATHTGPVRVQAGRALWFLQGCVCLLLRRPAASSHAPYSNGRARCTIHQ